MREFISKNIKLILAVVVTFAVATAVPSLAAGGFDAHNAKKVGGHTLKQLSKTSYGAATTAIDDFNSCSFADIYTRQAGVPAAGYLTLTSTVGAARDADDADEGVLTTRLVVDGHVVSREMSVNLENNGVRDATNVNEGVAKVSKGFHTIKIQGSECSGGMAFITDRQIVTQFSPNGLINPPTKAKVSAGTNR
jgi:hypothetical protein